MSAAVLVAAGSLIVASAASADTISTVAGNGTGAYLGDGGPATSAEIYYPQGATPTPDGGFLIADWRNNRIRQVSASGTITTVAGNGTSGFSGDGGPATSAELAEPNDVVPTADGGFLIVDENNNRIRKVDYGTITTVAGNGTYGFGGDGGPATSASFRSPMAVALTSDGGFLIADYVNNRIRKVSAAGTITTVAGNGISGFSGDGGPATSAEIAGPTWVASTSDGGFLIADFANNRIRKVSPAGIITTVAGNGMHGFSGDGGPATAAELNEPTGVAATPGGGFLIADRDNDRIRKVDAAGTITTVAGNGTYGFGGDGGPATSAELAIPNSVTPTSDGGFLIADQNNHRIRKVTPTPAPPPPPPPPPPPTPSLSGLSVSPHKLSIAGRKVNGHCAKPTRKNKTDKSCHRSIEVKISYTLNVAATVTFTWQVKSPGRKVNGKCVKQTNKNHKHHAKCTLTTKISGSITATGSAGANAFTFNGKLAGHTLAPGSYVLTATPTGGQPRTAQFTISA